MSPDPATIIAIISATIGAAGLGVTGYELANKPSANPRLNPQQVAQQKQQQAAIAREDAPNVLSNTSGGVAPNYIANAVAGQSGQGGSTPGLQDAIKAMFFGGGEGAGGGASDFSSGSNPLSSGQGTVFPSLDLNKPGAGSPGVGQFVDPKIFEGA